MRQAGAVTRYRERLAPPPSWWLGAASFAVVWGWLVLVVGGPLAAVVAVVLVALATGALLWRHAVAVEVGPEGVRAGRAHLDVRHVGPVTALDAAGMHEWLNRTPDARAWLLLRSYVPGGVRLVVDDPTDPTPYWLISSRRPAELAAALDVSRGAEPTDGTPEGQEQAAEARLGTTGPAPDPGPTDGTTDDTSETREGVHGDEA